jgi:hypothetical protein
VQAGRFVSGPEEACVVIRARPVSRAYARLLAGQSASAVGDAMFTVTAVLWADRLTAGQPWAAAAVSGVIGAAYAAVALAGPLAGLVVDRFDRRSLMAATELARAVLAGALAAVSFVPAGRLGPAEWLAVVYATVFGLNALGQLFAPAQMAVVAAIVPGEADRARAAGLAEAAAAAAGTLGPLAAVPLMLAAGVHWALAINAVSYLASLASVRSLPPCRPGKAEGGFRAGLRAFAASRDLRALLSVTMTCQLGAGALSALLVLSVTGCLHGDARSYGAASALMGAGYVAGAAAAGRLVRAAGTRAVVCGGLFAAAALTAAYALAGDVPAGLALLTGWSAAIGVLNTGTAPILMGAAPDGYLGRVMALWGPANQLAGAVSVLGSGWLASSVLSGFRAGCIGPVRLLLLIGAALIAAAGFRAVAALPPSPGSRARDDRQSA